MLFLLATLLSTAAQAGQRLLHAEALRCMAHRGTILYPSTKATDELSHWTNEVKRLGGKPADLATCHSEESAKNHKTFQRKAEKGDPEAFVAVSSPVESLLQMCGILANKNENSSDRKIVLPRLQEAYLRRFLVGPDLDRCQDRTGE